ncbi:hypothetical protein BC628DRAFT_494448 [Trametes gibbosa]|nr:hypothetical protein BC628DRAFT_494448 [Trametes gibbosa]
MHITNECRPSATLPCDRRLFKHGFPYLTPALRPLPCQALHEPEPGTAVHAAGSARVHAMRPREYKLTPHRVNRSSRLGPRLITVLPAARTGRAPRRVKVSSRVMCGRTAAPPRLPTAGVVCQSPVVPGPPADGVDFSNQGRRRAIHLPRIPRMAPFVPTLRARAPLGLLQV